MWSIARALLWIDPLILLCTVLMGSLSLLASLWDDRGEWQHRIARRWARMLLAVSGVRVRVSGLNNVPPDTACVYCANHLSLIDTPLVFGHLPVAFRTLAKKSLFWIPFLGWHLRRAGHMPVAPEDVRASARHIVEAARRLSQGISIVIFPEGARSPDGRVGPFMAGAFHIAIRAGAPVMPISVLGTEQVHTLGSIIVRPAQVELRIGRPIPTSGLKRQDAAALSEQVRDAIIGLMNTEPARVISSAKLAVPGPN